jgi:hypothetical protein
MEILQFDDIAYLLMYNKSIYKTLMISQASGFESSRCMIHWINLKLPVIFQ